MRKDNKPLCAPGMLWAYKELSWAQDSRVEKASMASKQAHEFSVAAQEVSDRIAREGPWPTARRLANVSFINRKENSK